MYIPAHFAADDVAVRELLARHGAADLITLTPGGLMATMLPFAYEPAAGQRGALLGHVARNNDQWRKPAQGESLAIVRGPDAYVSPSWYAAKAEHGRAGPAEDRRHAGVHVREPLDDGAHPAGHGGGAPPARLRRGVGRPDPVLPRLA